MKDYYVYILTNKWNTTYYIGVTNDIYRRLSEHRNKLISGFTKKYNIYKLLYYEQFNDIELAISREKQLKGWRRAKKIDLIKKINPEMKDLSELWFSD